MESNVINVGSLFEPLLEEIKRRTKTPEIQITHIPILNEMTWGIRKRKLTVIGARPSHGKSAFAVQTCIDVAKQNKSVVFFSLEMENFECAERILSLELELHNKQLQRGEGKDLVNRVMRL